MEKAFYDYFNFLLTNHEYLVIPGLGAFILNMEDARADANGKLSPPRPVVAFNDNITHNDGVLSSYIMQYEGISYPAACDKIKKCVNAIKADLKAKQIVVCGNIGSLRSDENGITIFSPGPYYLSPAYYGLKETSLEFIHDIEKSILKEKKYISLKNIAGGLVAAVVAGFLFIAPSFNIGDYNVSKPVQKAEFISTVTNSLHKTHVHNSGQNDMREQVVQLSEENKALSKPARTYYIVIGGESSRNRADKLLDKIKTSDFPAASVVEGSELYRIYVASFHDKKEAEAYLDNFRVENPRYNTAWLLSQKNRY